MQQKEEECPCTKADCERHGECVACCAHHAALEKPVFCRRPEVTVSKELEERVIARIRAAEDENRRDRNRRRYFERRMYDDRRFLAQDLPDVGLVEERRDEPRRQQKRRSGEDRRG